ncbi:MAG: HK97 family phage prohead protease [Lentisphaeria bacterium]|nr:HK97 family phage prohead protease [Lentisphaeria bacterium]
MNEREVRFAPIELRTEQEDERVAYIEGYPIVFNQETDMGEWREVIDPATVSDEKMLRDVALMVGHDFGSIPLAHSRRNNGNGTMQLMAADEGVFMRAALDVEGNPKAKEAYSAVKRGDLSGMSFAFTVNEERWEDLDTDKPLRRITGFGRIFEVSLVAFPAYPGTSVQAASEGDALESVRASLESAREQLKEERAREAEQERRTAALERLEKLQKEVRDREV